MSKYHYVYRITNIIKNKHYYGIRSTKILPIKDLGIKYFSSSKDKDFINDQKVNPQNYKYKIIRICDSRTEALNIEILLHAKFNVGVNESFYNKAKQTSIGFDRSGIMYKHTDETKTKIGQAHKGKFVSVFTRNKISELHKNKTITQQHKDAISKKLKGKTYSNEHNKKISLALKNKPKTDNHKEQLSMAWKNRDFVECPHCGKQSQNAGMMYRWHFDNCKIILCKS